MAVRSSLSRHRHEDFSEDQDRSNHGNASIRDFSFIARESDERPNVTAAKEVAIMNDRCRFMRKFSDKQADR